MAKLDFPDRDQSPWTNPDTGVTYVWKGGSQGAWHIASAGDTDIFVAKAGDKMTGDLTLGPEGDTNITLDAAGGNGTFEYSVNAARFNSTTITAAYSGYDGNNGDVRTFVVGPDGTTQIGGGLGNTTDNNSPNISLNPDGSANFVGTVLSEPSDQSSVSYLTAAGRLGGRVPSGADVCLSIGTKAGGEYATITGDGQATFANTIATGGDAANGDEIGSQMYATGGFYTTRKNGTSPAFRAFVEGTSTPKVDILASGEAEFASNVNAGSYFWSKNTSSSYAGIYLYNNNAGRTNRAIEVSPTQSSGSATAWVNYDGNAKFKSTNSATFIIELEPDNDTYYTAATALDPEGNVVENRVYNGPTLNVKERLQNLIARLDSLEAEELADDATSTLLLTTVNNLNADMTKTKAALTAIRTAANAAGTLEQLKADIATATADI